MRLSRDNLIVLGIVMVIAGTYALVIYRSQSKSLEEARTVRAERLRQIKELEQKAALVPQMEREIEQMRQRFNKEWDRRLPKSDELAGFLRDISANLAQEQLFNQMIQPGNPTRDRLYNRFPIKMKFEGDFLALAGFLQRVDEMTRLTRIDQLVVQPSRNGQGLSMDLGMNIYFTEY
jgi:Tfp pilus assembly protein PilO